MLSPREAIIFEATMSRLRIKPSENEHFRTAEDAPSRPPTSGGLLTVIEVARELRCSKAHVHNLINGRVSGVKPLPAIPLGRRRIVRRESLNEWIATNERSLA